MIAGVIMGPVAQIHGMIWEPSRKDILNDSPQTYADDFVVSAVASFCHASS